MALEFNCPYCQAIIRVPDNSAGKRGKCPKCASRLSIPKLGAARRAGGEQPFFPGALEPSAGDALPEGDDDDVIFQEYDPSADVGIDPELEASLAPGDVALPMFPGEAPRSLPRAPTQIPDSVMSKVKRRRKTGWVWAIAALLLIGGSGAFGFFYWYQQSLLLTGELTGQVVENPLLPAKIIPRTDIEMPPGDLNKILDRLQQNPIPLMSKLGLAAVQFQGSERGLLISVSPGAATSLYRVEISGHKKLDDYRREQTAKFEQHRREELSLSVNQLFRTLKKVFAKEGNTHELGQFRDSVGLTASVQGLGYFTDAVHSRQVYPCAYEDDDALYFLLPAGVKRFQLSGKSRKGSDLFFPGKFEVQIQGSIRLPDPAPDEPPPKTKAPEEDAEMSMEAEER